MAFAGILFTVLLAGILLAGQSAHARNFLTRQRRTASYEVEVTTGMQEGAGTDANVFITIYGTTGQSQEKKLKGRMFENNFEKRKVDNFLLQIMDVGEITKIKIRHDNSGFMPAWNLDQIRIVTPGGKEYLFLCNCVLKKGDLSKELFPEQQQSNQGGCEGVFQDASHCWPFNDVESNSSPDLKGGFPAQMKDGAGIVDSVARGKVASTLVQNSWIDLGDFNGKCISDPNVCMQGITMMFWAKIDQSAIANNPDLSKYVLSSGGTDQRSRGFSLFNQNNRFVLRVMAAQKKWRIEIPDGKIPLNSWFSFAFTWSMAQGLRYFINGQEDGFKLQGDVTGESHDNNFNDLRISKPNSNNLVEEMLPIKFDQFVIWSRVLQADGITKAFDEGGGLPSNEGKTNPQACDPNPCLNGGTCELDVDSPDGYRCVCLPQFAGLTCETKEDGDLQTTQAPTTAPATTAVATTAPTTTAGATTAPATTAGATTAPPAAEASTAASTTASPSATTGATTGAASSTSQPTTSAGSSTQAPSTVQPPTTPPAPGPAPDIKQLVKDLLKQINIFRRLHQSSDVSPSEELNQLANQWAQKLAAEGVEKIDPDSKYGQLVCSHHEGSEIAKACAVKWYSAIKNFDWADPKLTVDASPFTQMVWKTITGVGVGIVKGAGGAKRQGIAGKYYVVVYFDPAQTDEENIKENVLPAAGMSQPAPEASCPEGYSKLHVGTSRSCFSVRDTPMSWDDALLGCALDNGTLASLESREEADLVVNLLSQSNIMEAWIGLHDRSTEGRYVWVDGSPIPFSEWLPGEPDGSEAENCIVQSKGDFGPGWADKHCADSKAFVCEVPVPGYTYYKLTFNLTEQQPAQSYQNPVGVYSQAVYPGSYYSMCTPVIKNVNDLLRETITRYFQAKNISVQPVVNTIRCMPNGTSRVEVTVTLGPSVSSDPIQSLQISIKENDGELELSNGASAKLISVEILSPGVSNCPNQCGASTCQAGCDPSCCAQAPSTAVQQQPYPPPVVYQPEPTYTAGGNPWQCPIACTRNVAFCPPYCANNCCKRRSRVKIHKF